MSSHSNAKLILTSYTGKNLNNTYQQYDILHEIHTSTIRTNMTSRIMAIATIEADEAIASSVFSSFFFLFFKINFTDLHFTD